MKDHKQTQGRELPEEPRLSKTRRVREGRLMGHFSTVMADESGQAAVEMAVMLAMLTGSIVLTNEMFNLFLDEYINGIMFFLKHP